MNKRIRKLINITFLILLVSVSSFSKAYTYEKTAFDSAWDTYLSKISWKEEMAHLDSFSVFLKLNPDTIGYIAFYVGEGDTLKKAKARISRAVNFLTRGAHLEYRVNKKRIVVLYGGKKEHSEIILQPVNKDFPPPYFKSNYIE